MVYLFVFYRPVLGQGTHGSSWPGCWCQNGVVGSCPSERDYGSGWLEVAAIVGEVLDHSKGSYLCVQRGFGSLSVLVPGMSWIWKGVAVSIWPLVQLLQSVNIRTIWANIFWAGAGFGQVWLWESLEDLWVMEFDRVISVLRILGLPVVSIITFFSSRSSLTKGIDENILLPWHHFQFHSSGPWSHLAQVVLEGYVFHSWSHKEKGEGDWG